MKVFKMTVIITIFLSLLLSGCGSTQTTEIEQLKQQVAQLTQENAKLKDQQSGSTSTVSSNTTNTVTGNNSDKIIKIGDTVEVKDFCDFTINKVEFAKVIKPPKPNSVYSYYQVKDKDSTYLHVIIAVKNLQNSGVRADKFLNLQAKYNNKYDYTSFSAIEESGGENFTYTNITNIPPLQTCFLHYMVEVPSQVETDTNPLKVIISVNEDTYECVVR